MAAADPGRAGTGTAAGGKADDDHCEGHHPSDSRRVTDRLGHRWTRPCNMLIVGGQRCGTTTLYKALSEHPSFLGPNLRKGVHYFDLNFDESVDWYRATSPRRSQRWSPYQHRTGDPVVVGESSPYYMAPTGAGPDRADTSRRPESWSCSAIRSSARTPPRARTGQRLRDRTLRTRARARGRASRRTGTSAGVRGLVAQQGAPTPGVPVQRGEYITQLERLAAAVGRDNILVLDSADFWAEPPRRTGRPSRSSWGCRTIRCHSRSTTPGRGRR